MENSLEGRTVKVRWILNKDDSDLMALKKTPKLEERGGNRVVTPSNGSLFNIEVNCGGGEKTEDMPTLFSY